MRRISGRRAAKLPTAAAPRRRRWRRGRHWRSLKIAGESKALEIYGFGAAGPIVAQVAKWQVRKVFAFAKPCSGDPQAFARSRGVDWAGGSNEAPPELLDTAIIYATAGELVPGAL